MENDDGKSWRTTPWGIVFQGWLREPAVSRPKTRNAGLTASWLGFVRFQVILSVVSSLRSERQSSRVEKLSRGRDTSGRRRSIWRWLFLDEHVHGCCMVSGLGSEEIGGRGCCGFWGYWFSKSLPIPDETCGFLDETKSSTCGETGLFL